MSRGPITAELRAAIDVDREFMRADGTVVAQTFCVDRDDFDRLCDAIDAVHAGLERENAELRQRVAVLDESADSIHDGWVRLPLDADGVPIRVGDVMEERSGHTFEVASLMAFGGSDNWLVLSDPRNFASFREPHDIRHYYAPTVEDVLREFAYGLGVPVADSYVAASAAKLRLAGDAE